MNRCRRVAERCCVPFGQQRSADRASRWRESPFLSHRRVCSGRGSPDYLLPTVLTFAKNRARSSSMPSAFRDGSALAVPSSLSGSAMPSDPSRWPPGSSTPTLQLLTPPHRQPRRSIRRPGRLRRQHCKDPLPMSGAGVAAAMRGKASAQSGKCSGKWSAMTSTRAAGTGRRVLTGWPRRPPGVRPRPARVRTGTRSILRWQLDTVAAVPVELVP